ncbi:hypothetical protein CYG68_01780 [Morganella morganii]|uniref:Tail spike TSP1/Gp66 N-terminal domain-containing protein n=1 Tax=Morganella morganii TaxID=582 RepID=A0A8I0PTN2_MORMO|nr:hypothetical protein [Morganella morganii]MBE8611160.1 hypothetical protein [Morganella morganii]
MTVSTELSHEEYTGNGVTTDFDFRFRIFEAKHLVVSVADPDGTERILTNGTDYTLRGVGSYRGGKVILKMPLATGWKIGIARDLPAVQETDLRNQGKFFAEVHEDAFDYLTMLIQKSLGFLSLCLRKPSFISDHYDAKGNKISNLGKPVKDSDAVDLGTMKEHISTKDKRSLRVTDKDISALPGTSVRRNKQLGFDNNGMPLLLDPAETGALGYVLVDSFEKGAVITSRYQALHWLHNGEYYRWDGALPKTVPAGSTPDSAGGVGVGTWIGVGDASLRSELKKELVTESVKTDKLEITGNEITVGGSSVTFPDKDVNITNDDIFIGDVRIGRRLGDIYLSPFPSFELDFGEFEANGAVIPLDDPAADVLIGLSDGYKMRWGVYKTDIGITLPNLYHKDGRGRYLRAGNAGMMTDDTSQRVTADIRLRNGVSDNATWYLLAAPSTS